jgi:SAM-dependent methyltransferase
MQFDSLDFYREHAQRYSQLSHEYTHSVYTAASHPALAGDLDLHKRVVELASGKRGLDAGCGAGARDVYLLYTWGYDVYGIDAVEENISLGKALHPEIADRLRVADMREPLDFEAGFFDFVLCNAVIQHLTPETTETTTIPELARVLAPGGVLQLMFKTGAGVATVSDRAYGADGVDRSFQLYDEHRLLKILEDCGCSLVEAEGSEDLGGMLYFSDPKPMRYCTFWVRKD